MIRPVTCVCVLLAGASGLYLYQSKHRVQLLDRQIESTVRATQAARERTGVLRAEWTLLNDPERLAQLAGRFLQPQDRHARPVHDVRRTRTIGCPRSACRTRRRPTQAPEDPVAEPIALGPGAAPAQAQTAAAPAAKPAPERAREARSKTSNPP